MGNSPLFQDGSPRGMATMSPEMPNAKGYYRWIVSFLKPYFGKNILDIGGGYGTHLEPILLNHQIRVTSIDLSIDSVEYMQNRFKLFPHFHAMQMDFNLADVRTRLISWNFDTIICLNVLEHLEDDLLAVQNMRELLSKSGGFLLLMVPAHEWLYGSLDRQAGHYRRYNRQELYRIINQASFDIVEIRNFNMLGIFPWWVHTHFLKSSLEKTGLNAQIRVFDRYLVPLLQRIETRVKAPVGLSIIAVAKAN